jgi:hypothetical protein
MAREAGFWLDGQNKSMPLWVVKPEELKAFEALVRADERNRTWTQEHWTEYECSIAAAEREACADVVESTPWSDWFRTDCAAAIRARGNT